MIGLIFIFLFQINTQHPPVLVPLSKADKAAIMNSNMSDHVKTEHQIIDIHYPAGQPKASCGNRGESGVAGDGYRGRIANIGNSAGLSIIYVWETPKCLTKGVK